MLHSNGTSLLNSKSLAQGEAVSPITQLIRLGTFLQNPRSSALAVHSPLTFGAEQSEGLNVNCTQGASMWFSTTGCVAFYEWPPFSTQTQVSLITFGHHTTFARTRVGEEEGGGGSDKVGLYRPSRILRRAVI